MSRYRQQLARIRAERAPEIAAERLAGPLRQVRAGEQIPADAAPGEVFEVLYNGDGMGERPMCRVRVTEGLFGRRLTMLP